jgi:undecaprenyl-diphosphatase
MTRWDLGLFRWINQWPDAWTPFFKFMSEGIGLPLVRYGLLAVLVLMAVRSAKARLAVVQSAIAFPLANEITDVLKFAFPDPRPFQVLEGVMLRVGASDSMGTASAHSANTAAIATAMALNLREWGAPWIIISLLTGLSRIYCGAHFPIQVLLGWTVGIATGFGVYFAWNFSRNVRTQRRERLAEN